MGAISGAIASDVIARTTGSHSHPRALGRRRSENLGGADVGAAVPVTVTVSYGTLRTQPPHTEPGVSAMKKLLVLLVLLALVAIGFTAAQKLRDA